MKPISKRQREILHWLAEGYNPQQICLIMGIQYSTLKNHLVCVRQRWGIKNSTATVMVAFQKGIVW